MYTRQGHSPTVTFPRIVGIELVGTIIGYPPGKSPESNDLPVGTMIATCMGGLGRTIPGSYAEYACPSKSHVRPVPSTTLPIATIAALPELLQTVYGSLIEGLELKKGESLLVRGATSSIGLMAMQMAKYFGARVAGTTRSVKREQLLRDNGADEVYIDNGTIADQVSEDGHFDKVLELVGATTLKDSAKCLKPKGTVCMTGIQGGEWIMKEFYPMEMLSGRKRLTAYAGSPQDFLSMPWDDLVRAVEDGKLGISVREFKLDQIHEVHERMESGGGGEKMVVVT